MKRILIAVLICAILLCGCAAGSSSTLDEATPDQSTPDHAAPSEKTSSPPTQPPTQPPTPQELCDALYQSITSSKLKKKSVDLKAEKMLQSPELPTGCEAVALTIALNILGCDLDKTDIADRYLPRGNDIVTAYVGNPYGYGGAGILPPGLCITAQKYADDCSPDLCPYETTGMTLDELLKFVQKGFPVIMWSTYYMNTPFGIQSYTYKKRSYMWYKNEHCIVVYGYDLKDNTVLIADPLQGNVTYQKSTAESIYDATDRMSMVVLRAGG